MDFIDQIKQHSERVLKLKDQIATEEATKNSLILPMIQILGYDIFNPREVVPEFVADIGVKKGEKVDYAILKDGVPIFLIECKHWSEELLKHDEQLLRYFQASKVKFGILTNGIKYMFFTDLDATNIMDKEPFLTVDITNIRDNEVEELKKFSKSYFQIENITSAASELKYTSLIKTQFANEIKEPSEGFTKFFMAKVYDGMATAKNILKFSDIVRKSVQQVISDRITENFKVAMEQQKESNNIKKDAVAAGAEENKDTEPKIEITEEEIEGFHIVKSILRKKILVSRISQRAQVTFFGILLDDSNRKPICRFHFNSTPKILTIFDETKKEIKMELSSLDDIYNYSDLLEKIIDYYENNGKLEKPQTS